MRKILLAELLTLAVELIRKALNEQQAKDEFLELGCIHFTAQDVRGLEQEAFELTECDFVPCHVRSVAYRLVLHSQANAQEEVRTAFRVGRESNSP